MKFMATPHYQSMPEQYREAFEAHLQATQAMQYMEENARQQMGGM